jgi:3-hydroxyisobutyrate dehydrogenase
MRVALLGTGTMGAGMARSMRRGELDVTVWNRTRERAEPLREHGVTVSDTVADAVSGAHAVVTVLSDENAIHDVSGELLDALSDDAVWIQSSTVGPDGMGRIEVRAGKASLLDAPVLGTKQPAEEGKLAVLVSGDADRIERVQPVFDAIGAKTVVVSGRIGDASALKLACNAWVLTITAAAGQSLAIADALGVEPKLFLEAIADGAADTPYAQLKGDMMLRGEFPAAFAVDGGRKDLGLIVEAAGKAGVDPRVLEAVEALYGRAAEDGHGADDLAAVYTALSPTR